MIEVVMRFSLEFYSKREITFSVLVLPLTMKQREHKLKAWGFRKLTTFAAITTAVAV